MSPTLMTNNTGHAPTSLGRPLPTITTGGHHALVAAFLNKHYGGMVGHGVERPLGTITERDHHSLTAAFLTKFYGTGIGASVEKPLPTITAGSGHLGEVRAFLIKYHNDRGFRGQQCIEPLRTVDTSNRFGLVQVHGEQYVITDIGLRMLQPHELFAAQGFPDDYEIAPEHNGKTLTKTAQVALCGNAVCPQVAEAIVAANTG